MRDDPRLRQRRRDASSTPSSAFITEARIVNCDGGYALRRSPRRRCTTGWRRRGGSTSPDEPEFGTNVIPLKISREELRDGYVRVMEELYEPDAYFGRLDDLYLTGGLRAERGWLRFAERHPWHRYARQLHRLVEAVALVLRLWWQVPERRLRQIYRRRFTYLLRDRPDPSVMRIYAIKCAMHYHAHRLVEALQENKSGLFNTF